MLDLPLRVHLPAPRDASFEKGALVSRSVQSDLFEALQKRASSLVEASRNAAAAASSAVADAAAAAAAVAAAAAAASAAVVVAAAAAAAVVAAAAPAAEVVHAPWTTHEAAPRTTTADLVRISEAAHGHRLHRVRWHPSETRPNPHLLAAVAIVPEKIPD